MSDNMELPSHYESSYEGATPVLIQDCCGDPVPHHKRTCKHYCITIINPGSGYTSPVSNVWTPRPSDWPVDREYPYKEKPLIGGKWVSENGEKWAKSIGWQGGYINLETIWGPRLWADDEFWKWVKESNAKLQPTDA